MSNQTLVVLVHEGKAICGSIVEFDTAKELRGIKLGMKLSAALLLPKVWSPSELSVIHGVTPGPRTPKTY